MIDTDLFLLVRVLVVFAVGFAVGWGVAWLERRWR